MNHDGGYRAVGKSSQSTDSRYHAIRLLDDPDEIRATVRRAVTDSGREIIFSHEPEKAGVTNLLTVYQLLSGQSEPEIEDHFAGKGYGQLKQEVAEIVIEALRPIQRCYKELARDPATIDDILKAGAEEARRRSAPTLKLVKERVGFILPD